MTTHVLKNKRTVSARLARELASKAQTCYDLSCDERRLTRNTVHKRPKQGKADGTLLANQRHPIKGYTKVELMSATTERERGIPTRRRTRRLTRELSNLKYRDGIQMSGQVWPVRCNLSLRIERLRKRNEISCSSFFLFLKNEIVQPSPLAETAKKDFTCQLPTF